MAEEPLQFKTLIFFWVYWLYPSELIAQNTPLIVVSSVQWECPHNQARTGETIKWSRLEAYLLCRWSHAFVQKFGVINL